MSSIRYLPRRTGAATLRRVAAKGWSAEGLLLPLWNEYPGGRDALAAKVGSTGGNLSSINSGKRPLGGELGNKLALELGVSLVELGAPGEGEGARGRSIAQRLAEAEEALNHLGPLADRLAEQVAALEKRLQPSRRTSGSRR